MGAMFSAVLFGWPWHPRFSRYRPPRSSYGSRLDEGRIQRGNGSGGPTTSKPDILPKGQNARSSFQWPKIDPSELPDRDW